MQSKTINCESNVAHLLFAVLAQNTQKKDKNFVNIRDLNHEYLSGISYLLDQLVTIVCSKDCKLLAADIPTEWLRMLYIVIFISLEFGLLVDMELLNDYKSTPSAS